jgi:hypothetical protein
MAKKIKSYTKVKMVKDAARVNIGEPKATRAIPDAKTKAEARSGKHKKTIGEQVEEEYRG